MAAKTNFDAVIARMAADRDGVVSRSDLLDEAVNANAIAHRVATQRLHAVFPGVYAVGHTAISLRGHARAALLSVGDNAALSHLWAAAVDGFAKTRSADVDVIVPRAGLQERPGIRLHQVRRLDPRDVTTRHGLRITTVERALLDLADTEPPGEFERLFDEAIGLRRTTPAKVRSQLNRSPGRHGIPMIEALLARDYTARTKEEFERRMLRFIRDARLPHPKVNDPEGPFTLDFHWPLARFVVEADSRAWHSTRARQKQDARKDRYLHDRRIEVRRVRWWELDDEPLALAAELGATIAVRSALA